MTPRYFEALQKAFTERERREWERARYQGYLAVLPHVDSKKKRFKITDLGLFPWETPKEIGPPVTKEAQQSFLAVANAIQRKRLGLNGND